MHSVEAAWLKVSDGKRVEGEAGRTGRGRSHKALKDF